MDSLNIQNDSLAELGLVPGGCEDYTKENYTEPQTKLVYLGFAPEFKENEYPLTTRIHTS
jgi:hypothetical protein